MRYCRTCSTPIPVERLQVLPQTQYCVVHSSEKPKRGFISGSAESKYCEVIILDGEDPSIDYWEDRQNQY